MKDGPHSTLDFDRLARQGFPEVVLCERKTSQQIIDNLTALLATQGHAFGTRLQPERAGEIVAAIPGSSYHESGRTIGVGSTPRTDGGLVGIVTAGTSDLPVADEAANTLAYLGHRVARFTDIGVAGLHRLTARIDEIRQLDIVIVVAGMEGALPSVVGGLISKPLIAVPTSIGYGASFQGISALLGMLNSCAAGITVSNIDNGFGAGLAAHRILNSRVAKPS